jgi:hypothetical protein
LIAPEEAEAGRMRNYCIGSSCRSLTGVFATAEEEKSGEKGKQPPVSWRTLH